MSLAYEKTDLKEKSQKKFKNRFFFIQKVYIPLEFIHDFYCC